MMSNKYLHIIKYNGLIAILSIVFRISYQR